MVLNKSSHILFGIIFLSLSLASASTARSEVMFEGYSIIRSGSNPIGFAVQRYEFDAAKKQFTSIYFLKTNEAGGNITESLKAVANDKFQPVSYQYTTRVGDSLKAIDAKFAKDRMTGKVTDGKNTQQLSKKIPEKTFLSTFLGYLMLQNGYKTDKKFVYSAIAEEDAEAFTGEAWIKSEEDYNGEHAYRVLNKFKGTQFISFVTPKGEVIATSSPLQKISTELVASPAEATKGFVVPADSLKILFGSVPTGKVNVLAAKSGGSPTPSLTPSTPDTAPQAPIKSSKGAKTATSSKKSGTKVASPETTPGPVIKPPPKEQNESPDGQ